MPRPQEISVAAVKQAVDIVELVGEYLALHRIGSKLKALCPFHDDHNPSLELNPDRQSFRCWVCNNGGDVVDFIQKIEGVEFPEALRMLAERAGIVLEAPRRSGSQPDAATKTDLLEVTKWAQDAFAQALGRAADAQAYVRERRIDEASVAKFGLGYAPDERDWLSTAARRRGFDVSLLEQAGLVARNPNSGLTHDRFRGRVIFPIQDMQGRTVGFGGRVLPAVEKKLAESDQHVAKYINSPETLIFHKGRLLYAANLARTAAREAKCVAVVEGYTDVIAAHQAGLSNVVCTMGTALRADHVQALRRLADRVVLIFDGDDAGQSAADRALQIFLGAEIDLQVLSLPPGLDPADYINERGSVELRDLINKAEDPLAFAIRRAEGRFNFSTPEGARQAAESVLSLLACVPAAQRAGLDVKLAKALDSLSRRLGVPVEELRRQLRQLRRSAQGKPSEPRSAAPASETQPIRLADLDRTDRELLRIVLNEPTLIDRVIQEVPVECLRDLPLRNILQVAFDLQQRGEAVDFVHITSALADAERELAAGLLLPIDPMPLAENVSAAPWDVQFAGVLARITERRRQDRLKELWNALKQTDSQTQSDQYRALHREYLQLLNQRPDPKHKHAS